MCQYLWRRYRDCASAYSTCCALFLISALCGAWLRGFELGSTLPFAESYLRRLHVPNETHALLVGLLVGGGAAAEAGASCAAGLWADSVVETRALVLLSAVPQALGCGLYFFADTSAQLVLSRIISGLGAGAATCIAAELLRTAPARLRTAGLALLALARLAGVAVGPWLGAWLGRQFPDLFKHKVTPENAVGLVLLMAYLLYMLLLALIYPNLTAEKVARQQNGVDQVDSERGAAASETGTASSGEQVPCNTPPNSENENGGVGAVTRPSRPELRIRVPAPSLARCATEVDAGWYTPTEGATGGWFTPDQERAGVDTSSSPTVSRLVAQYEAAPKTPEAVQKTTPARGRESRPAGERKQKRDQAPPEGAGGEPSRNASEALQLSAPVSPFSPGSTSTRPSSAASATAEDAPAPAAAEDAPAPPATGDAVVAPVAEEAAVAPAVAEDIQDRPLEGPYSVPLALPLDSLPSVNDAVTEEVLRSPSRRRLRALLASWQRVLCWPTAAVLAAGAAGQLAQTSLQVALPQLTPLLQQPGWLLTADALAQTLTLLPLLLAPLLRGGGGGPLLVAAALALSHVAHLVLLTSVSEAHGSQPGRAQVVWCALAKGGAVLQCAGYALLEPAAVSLLSQLCPQTRQGRALAVWRLSVGAGLTAGLLWAGGSGRGLVLLLGPLTLLTLAVAGLLYLLRRQVLAARVQQAALVDQLGPPLPLQPPGQRVRTVSIINHLHQLYKHSVTATGAQTAAAPDAADADAVAAAAPPGGAASGPEGDRQPLLQKASE